MAGLGNPTKTLLSFGPVQAPVALYKTSGEPKEAKYDTAGPGGGALRQEDRAVAAKPEEVPVVKDMRPPEPDGDVKVYKGDSVPGKMTSVLVEDGTGKVVSRDEIRRGIRQEDGSFLDLTDGLTRIDEITALEEMRVVSFIDVSQVPRERVECSYYLGGTEPGAPKVLRLLFEAMKKTRRVAVVKWSKRKRQALGVVVPHTKTGALLVLQLSWADNWREPTSKVLSHTQAEVDEREIDAACVLVRALSETRDSLDSLQDDAVVMRKELMAKAEAGKLGEFIKAHKDEQTFTPSEDLAEQFESAALVHAG